MTRNQEVTRAWEARLARQRRAESLARPAVIVCGIVSAVLFFYCLLHN